MDAIAVAFVLGVAGLLVWSLLSSRIGELHRRVDRLTEAASRREREIADLRRRIAVLSGEPREIAGATTEEPALVPPVAAPTAPTPPLPPAAPATTATTPAPAPARRRFDAAALLARLPIWFGSVALALAGAFLVKYGWERDWLGPVARVALAYGFGLACLGGGTLLRRRSAGVARGLVAAGVAVLYAATLAGVHLYALIPAPVGFALMAATTAGAVALSLTHGAWVAVLGLVGGYLTPTWIGAREPSAATLFAYLVLLHLGLVAAGRARRRPWLPLVSGVVAAVWAAAWVVGGAHARVDSIAVGLFVWLLSASAILVVQSDERLRGGTFGRIVAHAGPVGGLVLLASLVGTRSFATVEWALFGAVAAGCVLAGRWRRDLAGLAWVALGGTLALLALWSLEVEPGDAARFTSTCASFGVGFALAGGAFARSGPAPWANAALSATAASAFVVVARVGLHDRPGIRWWAVALGAAAIQAVLAADALARRDRLDGGSRTGSTFAVGTAAATAVAIGIDAPSWTVAAGLAALALGLAGLCRAFPAAETRGAALAFGVLATGACLTAPMSSAWPFGPVRLFAGHGAALAALAAAAALARGRRDSVAEGSHAAFAAIAGGALIAFAVREGFRPDPFPRTVEWGVLLAAGTLHGLAARRIATRYAVPGLAALGDAIAVAALAVGTLVVTGPVNPVWLRFDVGATPVWNALAIAYGLPCASAALAAAVWRRADRRGAIAAGAIAIAVWLGFLLVTLDVRQAFRGGDLRAGSATDAELYAYSVAWIAYSLALLALSRRTRGRGAAAASAGVMSVAVVKVFLFDTGTLTGLYRVASLLGLGLTLLGLAYVYQRWVFARPAPDDDAGPRAPAT